MRCVTFNCLHLSRLHINALRHSHTHYILLVIIRNQFPANKIAHLVNWSCNQSYFPSARHLFLSAACSLKSCMSVSHWNFSWCLLRLVLMLSSKGCDNYTALYEMLRLLHALYWYLQACSSNLACEMHVVCMLHA